MSEQGSPVGTALPDADINAIMRMIPHRYPFLLVDRVVEMRAFQHAVGIKSVTMNEWFFPGHFPADPIMPGVLLIEAMGIPTTMFTAIFALARTSGWMAQWNEMIEDPEQKIGRPRQRYIGYTERPYVPIEER